MPDITITVSTELANRLRDKYGTLADLRAAVLAGWRRDVLADALAATRKQSAETRLAGVDADVEAVRVALEPLL